MIRFYIFILLSVFLQGCHGRKRISGAEEKPVSYPAAVVMPFAYDEPVKAEDANNFTDYFSAALRERGFQINTSDEAVADFSMVGQQGNPGLLQELADKYAVEGIILGKLQKFSYQREGRSFVISAEAEVEVLNLHNGSQVCQASRNLTRRFRVRNSRQTDFSTQNIDFLRQFTSALIGDLLQSWLLQEKTPDAEKPVSGSVVSEPEAAVAADKPEPVAEPEKSSGGIPDLKARLESRLESLRSGDLSQVEKQETAAHEPRWQELQPSSEKSPVISVRRLEPEPPAPVSPVKVSAGTAQEGLDLSFPGFQLVYPLEFDPAKKYEKFYYLLERGNSQVADGASVEDSVEENLVLEIFAAVNSFAVGRFLADYFQGVNPAPLSGIPEAFERNYLGKYQLGFMMGENAVIATGHRKYRTEILTGLSRFFENNGGVSLQSVIRDVASQAAEAGRKTIASSPERPASNQTAAPQKKLAPPVKAVDTAVKPPVKAVTPAIKPPVPVKTPQVVTTGNPAKKEEPVVANKPPLQSGFSVSKQVSPVSAQPAAPQFSSSQTAAPVQLQESATQPDARFFYNLGERYFHMQDYENALRFFADARQKGLRSSELRDYEQQLAVIMGNEPVIAAAETEFEETAITEKTVQPVSESALRTVVRTAAAAFAPVATGVSVALEYETGVDEVDHKPVTGGASVLPREPVSGLMDDFYREMDKIEVELEKIKKTRQGLSTKGFAYDVSDISVLILKILLLLGGCLAAFSFLSTKNIK